MQTNRRLSASPAELAARFKALRSVDGLAAILELRPDQLTHYAYGRGRRYRPFHVSKRRGGYRTILEPASGLKVVQQKLNQVFDAVFTPPSCVHGFAPERSIASNAFAHVRRDWVLNVDLKDFFPAINFGRVRGLLMARPYVLPANVATVMAQLSTFQDQLPQGSPTSPIVSNMIAAKLDSDLARLARRYRCTYTRYVDDLSFSRVGSSFPQALGSWDPEVRPERASRVGTTLRGLIERNGFQINDEKIRLQGSDERQMVTGLVVNEVVNLPRGFLRRIRAMLHAWDAHGHEAAGLEHFARYDTKDRPRQLPEFRQIVKGHIDFLGMIRGTDHPWYRSFIQEYARLDPDYHERPAALKRPNHLRSWRDAIWVIETETMQGTAFELEGCGLVTCAHVLRNAENDEIVVYHPKNEARKHLVEVREKDEKRDVALLDFRGSSGAALMAATLVDLKPHTVVMAAGYPRHAPGASLWEDTGTVTSVRQFMDMPRFTVNISIVAGASGSPVMDRDHRVIGMATTGAGGFAEAAEKSFGLSDHSDYGVIPIRTIHEVCGLARTPQ